MGSLEHNSTPENGEKQPESHFHHQAPSDILISFLAANPSIEYIRYQWLDYSGVLRVRNVTKSHCLSLATSKKPVVIALCAHTALVDNTVLNFNPCGSNTLWPDWQSLRKSNAGGDDDSYAAVMCCTREPGTNDPDVDYRYCPRVTLQRVLKQAEESYGLHFLIGFEVEFMLLGTAEDGQRYQLLQNGGLYTASACRTQAFVHVQECVDTLRSLDVAVQQFHSEGRSGQFEISLAPLPPMEAVDTLILTQEVIKNVAFKYGHEATMYPKPFADHPANGAHTHLSIHPPYQENGFLAGLLNRLPALCAFTMPTLESYTRVRSLEAGDWVAWGSQNRTTPVRKIAQGHWELRFADATANMYLALSACIGAGLLGLRNNERLLWKDCSSWCSKLSDAEKRDLGIATRLPATLKEALERLKETDKDMGEMLGAGIVQRYIQLKEGEVEILGSKEIDEVRNMYLQKFC